MQSSQLLASMLLLTFSLRSQPIEPELSRLERLLLQSFEKEKDKTSKLSARCINLEDENYELKRQLSAKENEFETMLNQGSKLGIVTLGFVASISAAMTLAIEHRSAVAKFMQNQLRSFIARFQNCQL